MRVLVAHNRYRSSSPSGENDAVDYEVALLRAAGVEVATDFADSDDLVAPDRSRTAVARAGLGPVYSADGVRRFSRLLESFRPDVVHVHNVYPLISPWVVRVATAAGVPVVQTVHNYRRSCADGTHLLRGEVCTRCLGALGPLPAVVHGCYRHSRLQSVPMAVSQVVHRGTWLQLAAHLALTPFMADHLVRLGVPRSRVWLRPNPVPDPATATPPGRDLFFAGRLVDYKGVAVLLAAWARTDRGDRRLVLAGDGPLAAQVCERAAADPSIRYLGALSGEEVAAQWRHCAALVVPSLWFEGYPRVVAEAFAHGRPVVASDIGSLATVVDPEVGWLSPRGSVEALAATLAGVTGAEVVRRGSAARRRYEQTLTPEQATASLLAIYSSVAA